MQGLRSFNPLLGLVVTIALAQECQHLGCCSRKASSADDNPVDSGRPLTGINPLRQSGCQRCHAADDNKAEALGDDNCCFQAHFCTLSKRSSIRLWLSCNVPKETEMAFNSPGVACNIKTAASNLSTRILMSSTRL